MGGTSMIDIQQIINSGFGMGFLSTVAGWLPARVGYLVADFVAKSIAAHPGSRMVRAVRANQWVVRGENLGKADLDKAVYETFRNSTCSIFDLYHNISKPDRLKSMIVFSPSMSQLVQRGEFEKHGLMVVGLHLGSFDLVLRALTLQGLRPMILTIPDPKGSQRVEHEMRKKTGMNILPTSVGALRQAIRYLQQGGVVMTGIDRPIPNPKMRPRFFGRPTDLPVHYAYLAVKAQVPVVVMGILKHPDGKNHIHCSDPVEMEPYPNPEMEILKNSEKILKISEDFIRQVPDQWSVSLPVWPEMLDQTPI
jgi:lauroyl/myristoyl acyltransferase